MQNKQKNHVVLHLHECTCNAYVHTQLELMILLACPW